jgi:hypothetical protein
MGHAPDDVESRELGSSAIGSAQPAYDRAKKDERHARLAVERGQEPLGRDGEHLAILDDGDRGGVFPAVDGGDRPSRSPGLRKARSGWLVHRPATATEHKEPIARAYVAAAAPRVRATAEVVLAASPVPVEAMPTLLAQESAPWARPPWACLGAPSATRRRLLDVTNDP